MLEISLRWGFAALLQQVQVIFDLFFIQLRGQATKMQRHSSYMAAVVIKSSGAAAKDGNITLKAFKKFGESTNFTTGTIKVGVPP